MKINLIGVPLFYGSDRRGADLGPNKLREKNIIDILRNVGHTVYDSGNLIVEDIEEDKKFHYHPKMKYLNPIVQVNTNLAHQVYSSLSAKSFPLILGGDHSLGLGSISGASKYHENMAVIWVDAHGDINTDETSPTGNVHGMPLAAAMGIGPEILKCIYYKGVKVKTENVFIIGARDLDEGEVQLIKDKNINAYSTEVVKDKGMEYVLNDIYRKLEENNVDSVHLSFDIDCIDSELVPGTGTPVAEGMSVEEAKYLLKYLAKTKLVKSMDFVELNSST